MSKTDRSLTNFEIDKYYQQNNFYGGCFSKDQLPKQIQSKFYIINMDNHNQGGSHWVLVYNCDDRYCLYFDSFGISPPDQIRTFMRKSKKKMIYPTTDYQSIDSSQCGEFCIYIINQLQENKALDTVFQKELTSDISHDEELISKIDVLSPHINIGGSLFKKLKEGVKNKLNKLHQLPLTIKKHLKWQKRDGEPKRFKDFIASE